MKRLYKSDSNKLLTGALAGIAEHTGLDTTVIRVLFLIATVVSGVAPGIIVYIGLAIIMPNKSEVKDAKEEYKA